jgi:hypothetical protein
VYKGANQSVTIPQAPSSTATYQVSAVVGSYVGPPSTPVAATTPDLVPLSISELDPSGPVQDTRGLSHGYFLTIAWEEPYYEASSVSYNIYRATTTGGEGATPYETGAAYSPVASDTGGGGGGGGCMSGCGGGAVFYRTQVEQDAGTTYYYQISEVVNVNGHPYTSPRSNEIALTVPEPPTPSRIKQINILPLFAHETRTKASDLVVDFTAGLNPTDAANLAAYHLVTLGKRNKKTGQQATKPVKLTSATYNPTTDTVTLAIKGKVPNQPLALSVNTSAVLDASGQPIAGSSGRSGSSFQATFGKKGITL